MALGMSDLKKCPKASLLHILLVGELSLQSLIALFMMQVHCVGIVGKVFVSVQLSSA